jgi:hypothetical protein
LVIYCTTNVGTENTVVVSLVIMMWHTVQLIEEYNTEYLQEPEGKMPAAMINQESLLVAGYNRIYLSQESRGF